jgi:5-(carboxyamino)imidazole ribonucleotide synthase
MAQSFYQNFKLGILGGGQLGRMLIQSGIDFNIDFSVLDPDPAAPCRSLATFSTGKLTEYETVLEFGKTCDRITIEIENVNTDALKELEKMGKKVYPQPHIIELIQDKRRQKEFYKKENIPTSPFIIVQSKAEIKQHLSFFPAVNKLGREGYDGRGVQVLRDESDLEKAFDAPGFLEKLIDFEKEIAVIVARNEQGEITSYPPVEMVFHPEANLVEYLFAPAEISATLCQESDRIAKSIIGKLEMVGLLAVEMFVTKEGKILVNEIAPRPHNSGHQTIEGNVTSQYEQLLRAIFNLPLGDTTLTQPSAMINLLGREDCTGLARYEGIEEVLKIEGAHIHLYGKKITKPFRKMGHVTIVDQDAISLRKKAFFVKNNLIVRT